MNHIKVNTKLFLIFFLIHLVGTTFAQTTFQKTYGDSSYDHGNSVLQTSDGGYIILGTLSSAHQSVYLIKTDAIGDTLWTRIYQAGIWCEGTSIATTFDGGYIISGNIRNTGDGYPRVYLIKTNSTGNLIWARSISRSSSDEPGYGISVKQASDSGFIITGYSWNSASGGKFDASLMKTDANGNLIWFKMYGQIDYNTGSSVCQTNDGGFIYCGSTNNLSVMNTDGYLVKTTGNGDTLWTKTIGGFGNDFFNSIQITTDSGYIIVGYTYGFGVDSVDVYLVKTNANGNITWSKTYGGTGWDKGMYVQQTSDGGFIITGQTTSFGTVGGDIYIIKTNSIGDTLWTKAIGGVLNDDASFIQQTFDHGYILSGYTGDASPGITDIFLVKTDSLGISGCNESNTLTVVGTPSTQVGSSSTVVLNGGFAFTPNTVESSGGYENTICLFVGINEIINDANAFSIYPNPTNDDFTIRVNQQFNNYQIVIYNILGDEMYMRFYSGSIIEINDYNIKSGIYFVRLITDNMSCVQKLIIE